MMKKIYSYLLAAVAMLAVVVATGCTEPKPEPTPEPKPEVKVPEISLVLKDSSVKAISIEVTVKNASKFKYAYYVKGERPATITWEEKAVEADGKYFVAITALTVGKTYAFEAFAANAQDSVSKALLLEFTVVEGSPLTVSEVVNSALGVSFKSEFLPADCDGFFYAIKPKADYTKEQFLADCKPVGMGQVFSTLSKKSGVHGNPDGQKLLPKSEYVLAIVAAKLDEYDVWTAFVGDVIAYDFTTLDLAVDQSTISVALGLDKPTVAFNGIGAEITRLGTNVSGFYFGAFKTADLAGTTLQAKVVEWLGAELPDHGGLRNYDMPELFYDEEMIVFVRYKLEAETPYTLFVVPFDVSGLIGKVSSDEVTTPALAFDGAASVDVVVTPGISTADCALDFKGDCEKAFFMQSEKGTYTIAEATEELLTKTDNPYSERWTPSNPTYKFEYLTAETEYDVFILPVGADGKLGTVQKIEFKTKAVEFLSAATMTVKIKGEPVFDPAAYCWKVDYEIAYADGAVSCEFIVASAEPGSSITALELAKQAYGTGNQFEPVTGTALSKFHGDYENGSHALFVPIDNAGERGAPVSIVINVPANPVQ